MILYSIIMAAYNAENTISRAIDSVLCQTYCSWELIIVDDGSRDDTSKIVDSFRRKNPKITYLYQHNKGPGSARNAGIQRAIGDYICFLDSDDYWEPNFLETVETFNKNGEADVVFYDFIRENTLNNKKSVCRTSVFSKYEKGDLISFQMSGQLEWGMVKAIKSSIIKRNNIVFDDIPVGEEAIFSFNVLLFSNLISFADKPIYHYVYNQNGQHKEGDLDPWYKVAINVRDNLFKKELQNTFLPSVNSLALKAFVISAYRIFLNQNYRQAKKSVLITEERYLRDFAMYSYNKRSLGKKIRMVAFCLKHRLWLVFALLTKLRGAKS